MLTSFTNWPISRRNLLRGCAFTGLATALSSARGLGQEHTSQGPRHCEEGPPPRTPAQALQALTTGNERWATCTQCHPREDLARRKSVVNGQSPFAAILSCSDSRVPPELVFDQGIGDLFVARVAGNCAGGTLTESLYYGTKEQYLGALVLFVLGHSDCGAVKAAIQGKGVPGQISSLFPHMQAAVDAAGPDTDATTKANAKYQARLLRESSTVISEMAKDGKIKVIGAYYDLGSGAVTLLE